MQPLTPSSRVAVHDIFCNLVAHSWFVPSSSGPHPGTHASLRRPGSTRTRSAPEANRSLASLKKARLLHKCAPALSTVCVVSAVCVQWSCGTRRPSSSRATSRKVVPARGSSGCACLGRQCGCIRWIVRWTGSQWRARTEETKSGVAKFIPGDIRTPSRAQGRFTS